jgi:hypothetical protein
MVIILWPLAIAGILTAACIKFLMLLFAYLKSFLAPEPVNSFEVYKPALFLELYSYSAITIPWMFYM